MSPEGRFRNRLGSTQKRLVKARLGTAKSVSEIPLVSCGIIDQDGGQAGDSQPNDTIMFESKIAITAIISTGSIMNEIKYDQNLI